MDCFSLKPFLFGDDLDELDSLFVLFILLSQLQCRFGVIK